MSRVVAGNTVSSSSGFNQRDMSAAKAVGLMQVTPEAGRDTAKRFGVTYDRNRLVSDPVYNTQMGRCRGCCPAQGVPWFLHHDVRRL
jgi:soluble lytic murein transglycosylase